MESIENVRFTKKGEITSVVYIQDSKDNAGMFIRIFTSGGADARIRIYNEHNLAGFNYIGSAIEIELESGRENFNNPSKRVENFKNAVKLVILKTILRNDVHKKKYIEIISKMLDNLDGRRTYQFVVKDTIEEKIEENIYMSFPASSVAVRTLQPIGFYQKNSRYFFDQDVERLDEMNQTAYYMLNDDIWQRDAKYMLMNREKFMIPDKETKNIPKVTARPASKPKKASKPVQVIDPRVAYIRKVLNLPDSVSDQIIKQAIDSIINEQLVNESGKKK